LVSPNRRLLIDQDGSVLQNKFWIDGRFGSADLRKMLAASKKGASVRNAFLLSQFVRSGEKTSNLNYSE
jgi:hypothetical protein